MRSTAEEAHPQKLQGERQLIHLTHHSRLPDFVCDSVELSMSGNHAGNASSVNACVVVLAIRRSAVSDRFKCNEITHRQLQR